MKYAVVVERSPTGFAAYVPDLPGDGEPIPEPTTGVDLVEV